MPEYVLTQYAKTHFAMDQERPRYRGEILKVESTRLAEGSTHLTGNLAYQPSYEQMMFVAGERGDPSIESTTIVENIVRDQTILMVRSRHIKHLESTTAYLVQITMAGELAARRGQARFTTNDILFQVRHGPGRLAKLRNHIRWKEIRKKAKAQDEGAADDIESDEEDILGEDEDGGKSPPYQPWMMAWAVQTKNPTLFLGAAPTPGFLPASRRMTNEPAE